MGKLVKMEFDTTIEVHKNKLLIVFNSQKAKDILREQLVPQGAPEDIDGFEVPLDKKNLIIATLATHRLSSQMDYSHEQEDN